MSYFVPLNASNSEISTAINYLLANIGTNYSSNQNSGVVNTSTTATSATSSTGATNGYLYRYLDVAFADNYAGNVNFSSTPLTTSKYYGLRNSNSSTYDTNPTDYVWYQVNGGFPAGTYLWYQTFGGLQINFIVATSAPGLSYQQTPNGVPIDLTVVSTATNLQARSAYTVSADTLASTPATYTTTGNSSFPPNGTWDTVHAETWVANPPLYVANQNVWEIDGIYNPGTGLTIWTAPYLMTLKVGSLSAINANLGTITAGTLNAVTINSSTINAGTTPPVIDSVNHTISSGAGGLINPNGTFAFGTTSQNIVSDGSGVYLNGFVGQNQNVTTGVILGVNDGSLHNVLTFTLNEQTTVLVGASGTAFMQFSQSSNFTPPAHGEMFFSWYLQNSSGTNVLPGAGPFQDQWSWSPQGFQYISTIPSYIYIWKAPVVFNIAINLPAGTYNLLVNGAGQFFNSSGTQLTGTNPVPSATYLYTTNLTAWWYTVNV
jgi:hypothetical protein